MDDRVERLTARLEELGATLRALEARVARLEGRPLPETPAPSPLPVPEAAPPVPATSPAETAAAPLLPAGAEAGLTGVVALAGRGLVLLGGAYLIRALTDLHVVPAGIGVGLGLLYAAVLLFLEDRAGRSGDAPAATAYAAVATAVACPLAWEATTRIGVFSPGAGTAVLGLAGVALLCGAARRSLPAAAWLAVLGVTGAGFAILVSTMALEAVLTLFLVTGLLGVVVSTLRGWPGLAWPGALATDLIALVAAFVLGRAGGSPEGWASVSPGLTVALLVALPLLALGLTLWRTGVRKAEPATFDFVQPSLAVAAGIGAAAAIVPRIGVSPAALGLAVLAAAALLLALDTLLPVSRRVSALHTTTGAVFVVAGGLLAVPGPFRAAFWSAAAVGAAVAFLRIPRKSRAFQTAVFVAASSLAAGLLPGASRFFLGGKGSEAAPVLASILPALGAAVAAYGILATHLEPGTFRWREDLPAVAVGTVAVLDLATVLEETIERLLVGGADVGGGSALRTITISVAAILLARFRRLRIAAPVGFLVYPLLAVAGLRIVLFDLREGRPATLFMTFAVYGAALILAPRFLRSTSGTGAGSAK